MSKCLKLEFLTFQWDRYFHDAGRYFSKSFLGYLSHLLTLVLFFNNFWVSEHTNNCPFLSTQLVPVALLASLNTLLYLLLTINLSDSYYYGSILHMTLVFKVLKYVLVKTELVCGTASSWIQVCMKRLLSSVFHSCYILDQ